MISFKRLWKQSAFIAKTMWIRQHADKCLCHSSYSQKGEKEVTQVETPAEQLISEQYFMILHHKGGEK